MPNRFHIGILATHPIQYYVPWYRALANQPEINLEVFYCHRQSPQGQAKAGFGVEFDWDVKLLQGYKYQFLTNRARRPDVDTFFGCDTPEIKEIINANKFDAFIVHGWSNLSFWQAIKACWKNKTPLFVRGDSYLLTNRPFFKKWIKFPFYRWFLPKFDAYLVTGKRAKEYYLYYGADEEKMFFVPHCVDNDFFSSRCASLMPQRTQLRREWNIPDEETVFLFAGKFIPKKRPLDFLKALRLASDRGLKIFGLLVGDGPMRAEMEQMAQKYNLPVTFAGFLNQSAIPKAYAVSDCLVLTSDIGETWGLVVNEAMACGLPAIVSDRAGCAPDLILSGSTGEEFQCGNIEELARFLINFSLRPEELARMKVKAADLISRYSIENSVEGLKKALEATI